MIPHDINASFDPLTSALIFRYECGCGLRSGWQDSPERAEADRPDNCRAHDRHDGRIDTCPACNAAWSGRTVGDGARLIATHMTHCIARSAT